MLRNVAKGHIWQFGVTAMPYGLAVLASEAQVAGVSRPITATPAGYPNTDPKKLHACAGASVKAGATSSGMGACWRFSSSSGRVGYPPCAGAGRRTSSSRQRRCCSPRP